MSDVIRITLKSASSKIPALSYETSLLDIAVNLKSDEESLNWLEILLHDNNYKQDMNVKNRNGDLPLHFLLKKGNLKAVDLFLNHGADLNFKDRRGRSAVMIATKYNKNAEIIKLLLDNGANVNDVTRKNRTPLHRACIQIRPEVIKVLLDHGANFNAVDNLGRTPLLYLLFNGMIRKLGEGEDFLRSLKLLLLHDASNVFIGNAFKNSILSNSDRLKKYGLLRLDYVKSHTDVWRIIVKYLARLNKLNVDNSRIINVCSVRRWFQHCYTKYLDEIDAMKNIRVHGSITFYNLLMDCVSDLAYYPGYENLMEAFQKSESEIMFPAYSKIISDRLALILIRRECLDDAATFLTCCIPNTDASHIAIRKIMSYLSTLDLKVLSKC